MPQDAAPFHLPAAVAAYFTAKDAATLTTAFAEDAVVQDEGRQMRGHDAIIAWKAETTAKYQPRFAPLAAAECDGKIVVTCEVSGNFPGSPIKLDFAFTLRGERIAALEIH